MLRFDLPLLFLTLYINGRFIVVCLPLLFLFCYVLCLLSPMRDERLLVCVTL